MSTKSTRSSGTQHNQRGVTQGNTLVDPKSGLPITVITDNTGAKRLAVDAQVTATVGSVDVNLVGTGTDGDNIFVVDNATGNKLKVNSNGSLDVNAEIDAAGGDNIAIHDSNGHELKINSDGSINVNGGGGGGTSSTMSVVDAISATNHNIQTAAYSATSDITQDYILDHIQFNFSTRQARDIVVTAADGTKLWEATADTSLNIVLEDIDKAFNENENFTITVSQTGSACLMTVLATILQGNPMPLGAVTQVEAIAGDNIAIGNTWKKIVDQPNSTTTYIGIAAPGSSTGSSVWQIKRILVSGTQTFIEFSGGNLDFNKKWDDRATLSYN